jgi:hypothetical protein
MTETGLTCSFALHAASACGPQLRASARPLQTLNELDAAWVSDPAAEKTSWTLLSRVGVNFLASPSATGCWTICYNHRRQLLDTWQPDEKCCSHNHVDSSEKAPCERTVSSIRKQFYVTSNLIIYGDKGYPNILVNLPVIYERKCGIRNSIIFSFKCKIRIFYRYLHL